MLIIAALAMVIVLGFLAMALDGGMAYAGRRTAQNAADAAALAGAKVLQDEGVGPAVQAAIYDYSERNNLDVSAWSYVYEEGEEVGVAVTTTSTFSTSFASIMGIHTITTVAPAEARMVGRRLGSADSGGCDGDYAIWADVWGGQDKEVYIKGEEHVIVGNVHSNDDLKIGGKDHTITGGVTYVDTFSDNSQGSWYSAPQQVTTQAGPVSYDVADYQPGGSMAVAAGGDYHYTGGNLSLTCSSPQGLYYATGHVTIDCEDMSGQVTIVAEGYIKVHNNTGSIVLSPYSDGLLFFSNRSSGNDIDLNGEGYTLNGILYAPNGEVKVQAEAMTLNGSMVGKRVEFTGGSEDTQITFDETYCPSESSGDIFLSR